MKTKTVYVTDDNQSFDDKQQARKHEIRLRIKAMFMGTSNIQLNPSSIDRITDNILNSSSIALEELKFEYHEIEAMENSGSKSPPAIPDKDPWAFSPENENDDLPY